MVIHDGDHRCDAVLRDLRLYAGLVPPGGYLVVEDGVVDHVHTHRVIQSSGGPSRGHWKR